MQKVIVSVVVAWLLIVAGSINLVYSQPAGLTEAGQTSTMRLGRDLSLTVGLDIWPNQWITNGPVASSDARSIQSRTAFRGYPEI